MEILQPGSNGIIHEEDLSFDKTPVTRYKEVMDYLMKDVESDSNMEDEWEGGGDGHMHHARDEL